MPKSKPVATEAQAKEPRGAASPAFLLAQVGAHAAAKFAERLAALDLTPSLVGTLPWASSRVD
jgi:hypothetical protein